MKKTNIYVSLLTIGIVVASAIFMDRLHRLKQLSPKEREAMNLLPGYKFLFRGKCLKIHGGWTYQAFHTQHMAIPFLEDVVPYIQGLGWTKDRPPIEVTETEETIVVTIPRWPPKPEDKGFWYESEFLLQVTYDKETGKRISAWSGL